MLSKNRTLILFFFLLIPSGSFPLHAQQRPNVVLIIGDDISYNDFGCYGHPVIKTPHVDNLAAGGLRFTNAFLTASSCSPSRASIITGRYPHNTGAAELHTAIPDSQVVFPRLLREAGYYTAQAGKWHFGAFPPKPGDAMSGAFDRIGGHEGDGGGTSGAGKWVEYLQQRPKDKPFFMWFAALDAHRGWDDEFKPVEYSAADVVVPPNLIDSEETRDDLASYYSEVSRFDDYIGKVVDQLKVQGVLEQTVIIVMADNGRPFPRNKTRLYDEGIKTPLIIHGPAFISRKGAVSKSLISAIDIAPTILDLAGVKPTPGFQGRSFSRILANPQEKFRQYVFAEHNWHDFRAFERMVRTERFLYIENGLPSLDNRGAIDIMGGGAGVELKRAFEGYNLSDLQKSIFNIPQPAKEFYDCSTDTLQALNLYGQRKYAKEQKKLAQVLTRWKDETGDSRPARLTEDWYDRDSNKPLSGKGVRGDMPGADRNAARIEHPGPF